MYRILEKNSATRERRNQLSHPIYTKPELLAVTSNQVWSWDITKLKGPEKWTYFYLYVILDIYSRYVVGWMLADRESGSLARQLISESQFKTLKYRPDIAERFGCIQDGLSHCRAFFQWYIGFITPSV